MGLNIKVVYQVETNDDVKIINGVLIDFKHAEDINGRKELMGIIINSNGAFRLIPYYDIRFEG